jgi:hypothetical protein
MIRAPLPHALLLLFLAPALDRADEPAADYRPDPAAVQRYGPAYCYPQAGWIVLHIEGEPYERGYQHGRLLATEIAAHLRCFAAVQSPEAPAKNWQHTRRLANSLFLRRFEKEFLEEMKGIADGAAAAGAKLGERPVDLVDIVALNCWAEIDTLDAALEATPTGLEGLRFPKAQPRAMPKPKPERCSAFAATGPATADGKVVFGHITMFSLYPAGFYNVWLDIKPAKGHRMLMCAYPGAIQSGMDYYLNDAGLLIAETTISQTRFDGAGQSETSRIRQAIQYAATIDEAALILKKDNNGLYTNEWLLADINTNEIALYELGTHKSKLHRSSKNEWIGGTAGFYWGCNNTKDIELRLETVAGLADKPANLVFRPSGRDQAWQQLYHKHKGKIGVAFGKEAFTTPPIASFSSLDAKFTTTDLAKQLKSWALFGPPLGRTWQPTQEQRRLYPEIKPLVSNPWTVLNGNPPPAQEAVAVDVPSKPEKGKPAAKPDDDKENKAEEDESKIHTVPAWHGTLLPRTDGDIWLATAFADYEKIVAKEKALRGAKDERALSALQRDALAVDLFACQSAYLAAVRAGGDQALADIKAELADDRWYRIASGKGVLALAELRRLLGDPLFEEAMDSFGRAHAGKRVTTAEFQAHVEKASGKSLREFFDTWIARPGLPPRPGPLPVTAAAFSILSFHREQERTLIVYGTGDEVPTNREAAEALQKAIRESGPNFTLPIKSDKELSEGEAATHHLLLIGRPDSNSLVRRFEKDLPITFGSRSFRVRDKTYAHPGSAVIVATTNPLNPRYSAVAVAGLSAESTLSAAGAFMKRGHKGGEVLLLPQGGRAQPLILPTPEPAGGGQGAGSAGRPR